MTTEDDAVKILTDCPDAIEITGFQTGKGLGIYGTIWRTWKKGSIKILPNGIQLLRKIRSRYMRCIYIVK
ncbi:hypothetical protein LCGC14_0885440 [marine sediment metagenome]|uniref:Uncharacterized protein n=1 Tax=marine sediment metagenome TaxID=412755 RepID=A0A0F9P5Q2_9ZZZZ